ncbi:hypothetical protein LZ31DRAFT_257093 [Colletotrichum somersetense]|nr:hypothetical protein LZ31DRAFT_257093 [Colletotrichum somersetense]
MEMTGFSFGLGCDYSASSASQPVSVRSIATMQPSLQLPTFHMFPSTLATATSGPGPRIRSARATRLPPLCNSSMKPLTAVNIFYTVESWADPVEAWEQVWLAHMDNSKCVEGSPGHKGSISGGYKPFGSVQFTSENEPSGSASDSKDKPASSIKQDSQGMALLAAMFGLQSG